jgi:hypothetical protein
MTRRQLGPGAARFDVAAAIDFLREIISRTDALVHATEHQLERFTWRGYEEDEDGDDDRRFEHLAHLLGAAKEAARAAVTAGDQIAADLLKHRGCV